jgi:hypothetical protein
MISNEPLVDFIVVYSSAQQQRGMVCHLLHLPEKLNLNRYSPKKHMNKNVCGKETWTYSIPRNEVDAVEHAIALCQRVICFSRGSVHGECARTTTFFGARSRDSTCKLCFRKSYQSEAGMDG